MEAALSNRCVHCGPQYKTDGSTSRCSIVRKALQNDEAHQGEKHILLSRRSLALGATALLGVPSLMLASAPQPAEAVRTSLQQVRLFQLICTVKHMNSVAARHLA